MSQHASLPEAIASLLAEARSNGWIAKGWTISELDMRHLRDELGRGDVDEALGGLPVTIVDDDTPITLHAVRALSQADNPPRPNLGHSIKASPPR